MEKQEADLLYKLQQELNLFINTSSDNKHFRSVKSLNTWLKKVKKDGEKRWHGFKIDFVIKYTEEKKFGKKEKVITGDIFGNL